MCAEDGHGVGDGGSEDDSECCGQRVTAWMQERCIMCSVNSFRFERGHAWFMPVVRKFPFDLLIIDQRQPMNLSSSST